MCCWSLDAAPLLGHGIPEKKPWSLAKSWNWSISDHTSALEGGGMLLSCRRGGMEMLLYLICRVEAWAVFSISSENCPLS